jgi:hypothetical protein
MLDKQIIASDLRMMIEYYTELTVNEHMSSKTTPEADKAWKKIDRLINQLTRSEL